ncbi:MAG: peptidoglycan DD-metalloendopeptidase family protein [Desulfuromusa sp.]|jgi:murein DD-endopeptidase|nr:peptidoglycan DD-metalloendopeptidase family protein [Desulfuromusa sp.]
MNATWKPTPQQQKRQRRNRRLLSLSILLVLIVSGWFFFAQDSSSPKSTGTDIPLQARTFQDPDQVAATKDPVPAPENDYIFKRTIQQGDNLSAIFESVKINQTSLFQILEADESLLALDILRPGNTLTFTLDKETRQLAKMELFFHPAHQVIYHRVDENSFDYNEIVLPGTWEPQLLDSEIEGSFYQSALAVGLSEKETGNITYLFKNKVNFSRDIRAGDHFQVVRSLQLLDGKLTGQSHIEAVRIFSRNHQYNAFLYEDGNYYDDRGESLGRAFQRYPFKGHRRVSSPYNLARLHPITKRISPHKGVDFSMPTGTPVYATGDGVVTRVKNHRYAGKYIEIQHDGRYLTRYLHLSRITVKRGQKVQRGERIALSGNTGRSTGPHLHYELHVKGRAVNPLKAKIPMAASIPKAKLKAFKQKTAELTSLMEQRRFDLVGS